MQFLTALLGDSGATVITAILALAFVLVLIVSAVWLLKATLGATSGVARPRGRRMQVVEQLQIDPKRQMLIVRRDDVEHVILTGGTQDVVVETGIRVDKGARKVMETEPGSGGGGNDDGDDADKSRRREDVGRLRDLVRAGTATRRSQSLRHTGLLRPVSTMEPAVIPMPGTGAEQTPTDSDKTSSDTKTGQGRLGGSVYFTAERRADK